MTVQPDDHDQVTIAARLGKSVRWLQVQLAEDRRRRKDRRRLQFHHYIGRSPRWDEAEYQALRAALIAPSSRTTTDTPSALSKLKTAPSPSPRNLHRSSAASLVQFRSPSRKSLKKEEK